MTAKWVRNGGVATVVLVHDQYTCDNNGAVHCVDRQKITSSVRTIMSLNITASVTDETKQAGDVISMVFYKNKLYTGAEGGKMVVYNPDLSIHNEIQAQYNTVNSMCIFQGHLATTGNDGLIKLWNTDSLELMKTLEGHENEIRRLFASHDKLYSGDMSGKVKIWDSNGSGLFTLSCVEEVWDVAVQDDICFSVRDKDITRTQVLFRMNDAGETKFIIMDSFQGRPPLALLDGILCYCDRTGYNIELRDSKDHMGALQGHTKIITSLATHSGILYSGGYDNSVKMWDIKSKQLIASGTTVNSPVHSLAIGDDGAVYAGLSNGFLVKMLKQ